MELKLDKSNPIPLGVQVKEQLKMMIASGIMKTGEKLPSITKMADKLGVNKNTIVTVLDSLEKDGYIESYRGKGVFVKAVSRQPQFDKALTEKVDRLILEVRKKNIDVNELVNFISARFLHANSLKSANVLFIMGFSQELVDVNLQKLKQNITGAVFDGLYFTPDTDRDRMQEVFQWADLLVVPAVVFPKVQGYLPNGIPVVKTESNLNPLRKLKKGIEKKSRVAVIGSTQDEARMMAELFISAGYFRPRMVLELADLEKAKKELKEMEAFVFSISARSASERLKLKDREVYFLSDYIHPDSMEEIKLALRRAVRQ